jgi:hypothetical protein
MSRYKNKPRIGLWPVRGFWIPDLSGCQPGSPHLCRLSSSSPGSSADNIIGRTAVVARINELAVMGR